MQKVVPAVMSCDHAGSLCGMHSLQYHYWSGWLAAVWLLRLRHALRRANLSTRSKFGRWARHTAPTPVRSVPMHLVIVFVYVYGSRQLGILPHGPNSCRSPFCNNTKCSTHHEQLFACFYGSRQQPEVFSRGQPHDQQFDRLACNSDSAIEL